MCIRIVEYQETYRLIQDDERNRWAVVEARCQHVYSLDAHHAHGAPDSEQGMAEVVGENGWEDEAAARRCFEEAVGGERRLSQLIW